MKNIAVLISGNGTNLQAIIDNVKAGNINGKIVAVISNKADAFGLERAKKADISTYFIDHKGITREEHEQKIKPFPELSRYRQGKAHGLFPAIYPQRRNWESLRQ